jgi:cyclic pyranopterin phosphate synthase
MAKDFLAAGVTGVNVSVDSLDAKIFAQTTGTDQLSNVLAGIDAALNAGFKQVKVNAVLMRYLNEESFENFLGWIKDKPITVRFIELMPTGQNKDLFAKHHVRAASVVEKLNDRGWTAKERGDADGPALELIHPDFVGRMGVIAPYAKDFCATCNRLRVTSQGGLRLCLFGEGNHNLRDLLQDPLQKELLQDRVFSLLHKKEISHYLPEGRYGNNNTFSAMGG